MINEQDLKYLRRCITLAETALQTNDEPFGSILVAADGEVLFEDFNHISSGDNTQHPEFALARWAANHLSEDERATATVYTSGEHCPMCAAAHGWVGLNRIVYASSSAQLAQWLQELDVPPAKVRNLRIQDVITDTEVEGPVEDLAEEVRQLHYRFHQQQ